jgi:hypothetical protein
MLGPDPDGINLDPQPCLLLYNMSLWETPSSKLPVITYRYRIKKLSLALYTSENDLVLFYVVPITLLPVQWRKCWRRDQTSAVTVT